VSRTDAGVDTDPTAGTGAHVELVVFDVNETLSDMSAMAGRFEAVGAPGTLAATWFAAVLRDGFALTAAGESPRFAEVAAAVLHGVLSGVQLDRPLEEAADHVLSGFSELDVHPDVVPGIMGLRAAGLRLVTLSNGGTSVAEALLGRAGIRHHLEELLSVEGDGPWKPTARSYACALTKCGVPAERAMLVAVHPWDVHGARRAGMATCWLNRSGVPYPDVFAPADVEVDSLPALVGHLRD